MEAEVGEALLLTLFMVIRSIAGYPEPAVYPEIHRLPAAVIAERVCGRPCDVRAAFIQGEGVLIDETFDVARDPMGMSVLLHELVHYVQERDGAFSEMSLCRRHSEREYEAYWVQDTFLRQIAGSGLSGLRMANRIGRRCLEE